MWAWTPCWSRVGADGPTGPSQPLIAVILWSYWLSINWKTDRKQTMRGIKLVMPSCTEAEVTSVHPQGVWGRYILFHAWNRLESSIVPKLQIKLQLKDICCSAHHLALHRKPSHNPAPYKHGHDWWWPWFCKIHLDLSRWKALQVQIIQNSSARRKVPVWKANTNLTFIWKTHREFS